MFILQLNPMRGRTEDHHPVARAHSRYDLETFVAAERVEPYREDGWLKFFRKGGPLEWYNPPEHTGEAFFHLYLDVGTAEDWMAEARHRYELMLVEVPPVPDPVGR